VDARLLASLLDDLLALLPRRVDRRLEDELELLPVLRPNAVVAQPPTCGLQHPVRLVDAEFPLRVRRPKALRVVEEVARRRAAAAVDVFLYRGAIDKQIERLAHRRIGQSRVARLRAR